MLKIRRASERGTFNYGWLETFHSFSFGEYYDPDYKGFRALRVINEDFVQPGKGFQTHSHHDMEIITYLMEGELAHRDSLNHGSVIKPGEVQYMCAGRGVTHSELNNLDDKLTHLIQIWITPHTTGLLPRYEQKPFPIQENKNRWILLASPDGAEGSITIQQDAQVLATIMTPSSILTHPVRSGRYAWIQIVRGAVTINGQGVSRGDGVALSEEPMMRAETQDESCEILLFDLP